MVVGIYLYVTEHCTIILPQNYRRARRVIINLGSSETLYVISA